MLTREEYEAKRQARLERLQAAAARAAHESDLILEHAHRLADVIPFGQPILVGHHSEGRDRRYRNRIENHFRRGFELYRESQQLQARAEVAAKNDAIFSDDPDAGDKLDEKIAALEAKQEQWKAINSWHAKFLKDPASLDKCPLDEGAKKIIREYVPDYSWNKHPIAGFQLTNNNANIRRLKERQKLIAEKQSLQDEDYDVNGIRIEGRPGENRIRIFYPGRVSREVFDQLRQHGFRVLRSAGEGAFSAYYNYNARCYVSQIVKAEGR